MDPNGTRVQVPLTKRGIAWWTDKHVKFRNPGGSSPNLTSVFQGEQQGLGPGARGLGPGAWGLEDDGSSRDQPLV